MDFSKLTLYAGSRAFWFLFGMILGVSGLFFGLQRALVGESLIGFGLIVLGIQGLLRPVVLSRPGKISKEEMSRQVSIGSDALHGGLSLLMAGSLVAGFVLKYLVKM
ncbi:hypothetical protein [Massilia brevitalea]|uniref:hypothetical protein n=1 Tax=Massilia brevitalea TaxID=442526 RepID=UPI002738CEAA|nr:hypothetical protein [Massilia brevitalea]